MNIGYIKIRKQNDSKQLNDYLNNVLIKICSFMNIVEQDKYKRNVFTIYNTNEKSKINLIKKLCKENIEYVLTEGNEDISYPTVNGKYAIRSMIPETVEFCQKIIKPRIDEIHICTNIFNSENRKIVEELIDKVKVVNIVTDNKNYSRFEKRLEEKGIYITVSNNKRQSLKNATIVINLDFKNFKEYNINRNMVLIDTTGIVELSHGFNGIAIRKILINTKKVMRVFSEYEEFDKDKLIEAEMMKLDDYIKVRKFIKFNKIYIDEFYNIRKIELKEFKRIEKLQSTSYKSRPKQSLDN